jgi:hypothetical protein
MQHFPLVEKLHTDVLEEKYGKIHAEVLKHNSKIRESLLVDSKGIARTYALTFFENLKNKEIEKINEEIKKGGAIGKTFRKKKYSIRKNVLDVFIIKLPSWLRKSFNTKENYAKARLSEFYAKKSGKIPIIYGIVTEVYTPDFRKPKINETDKLQIGVHTECLENNGFTKSEIYRRIGINNNYEDSQKRYNKSKEESKKIILKLRKKIEKEIKNSKYIS